MKFISTIHKFKLKASADDLDLALAYVVPEGNPKGLVQLVHGMCGHKERFYPFMKYLASHGYVCVIHDHRGHGASVKSPEDLGYMYDGGWKAMVEDIEVVRKWAHEQFSGETTLLGHSMGSLAVRSYAKRHDAEIDRLIVCGTPKDNRAAGLGKVLFRFIECLGGGHWHMGFIQNFSSSIFNRHFRHEGYANAWACSDKKSLEEYKNDPLCQFSFTANGFANFLALMQDCFNLRGWTCANPEMPVHFLSGGDDPCMGRPKDFQHAVNLMKSAGYQKVSSYVFPHMRHEILNETDKLIVWNYILQILSTRK